MSASGDSTSPVSSSEEENQPQHEMQDNAFKALDKRLIETIKKNYGKELIGKDSEQLTELIDDYMQDDEQDEIIEAIDDEEEELDQENTKSNTQNRTRLIFRNYDPMDYKLKRYKKRHYATLDPHEKTSKYFASPIEATEVILRDQISGLLEEAAKLQSLAGLDKMLEGEEDNSDSNLLKPRKLNEDLKRHIKDQMDFLEKQTNQALREMLQERIEEEEEEEDEEEDNE
ncbi:hypothetical protein C9374_006322 [Naegleria lovaniensis]|uniref:Uncharacterized protein n=1 Tax=Naegleria lovaniensis TaxID=51637 RepID=A0AA88KJ21_NAELO|nr:uncharacterized protein C9374_006322 [Naegleria lovaniensis]KAG2381333.1 hypothetical protein C9374_006322 [Naegleria lovaniensis]